MHADSRPSECGALNRSEDGRHLDEQCVALIGALAKLGRSPLVGDLDRPKRWKIAIDEHRLNVSPVDDRVGLEEHPQKQIGSEELGRPDHMDPGPVIVGVGVEDEPLKLVLG